MKLSSTIVFYSLICASFILLFVVFQSINYLAAEKYIMECFTSGTSHTVNLPLTTKTSCTNFCGPTARCATTGHQCLADADCPGCQSSTSSAPKLTDNVAGNNDAGKLTVGMTPTFSPLTSGYGTRERIITDDLYSQPAQANFGVDTWGEAFNETQTLFNRRYKTKQLQFMPSYPLQYSATGDFVSDGPLPSNY
jgi:hypothetical protein